MTVPSARQRDRALRGLLLGSPRKVLARILPGDPLGLRQRVAEALERRTLALDPDATHLAALARVAQAAPTWTGDEPLEPWLERQVDAALDDRLREEATAVAEGVGTRDEPCVLRDLARPLEIEVDAFRAACRALNRRPATERRAFVRLVLDREDPEVAAAAEGVSLPALARRARSALLAVLAAGDGTTLSPDAPPDGAAGPVFDPEATR